MIAMMAKVAEMATTTRCNSHASKFLMSGISPHSKERYGHTSRPATSPRMRKHIDQTAGPYQPASAK